MGRVSVRWWLGGMLWLVTFSLHAAIWHVAPGELIASTIARAAPGDVVEVARGDYHENLLIDKPLTLRGIERPTLSGGNEGDTLRIRATHVTVENFIIRDSGSDLTAQNAAIYVEPGSHDVTVRNNFITYALFGLWIHGVERCLISGNNITGKRDLASPRRGNGIQLYLTHHAQIIGNEISYVRDGIYVDVTDNAVFRDNDIHDVRYGTHYMNSHHNLWEGNRSHGNRGGLALMMVRNNIVRNNQVWGNSDHGIMLRTMQDSQILDNVVADNGRGFFIYDAEYNGLKGNLVINNRVGVHLWAGSIHNNVEGNDFINNQEQVRYVGAADEVWGGERSNYWSNYTGWDRDGNGRGDLPYEASDLVDRMTWRNPLSKLLLNSPAVQTLHWVGRQFPLLRAPSVVDREPQMIPYHHNWSEWLGRAHH